MKLRTLLLILLVATLLIIGCTLPFDRERSRQVPDQRSDTPVASPSATATATQTPSPTATATEPIATPTPTSTRTPPATPTPEAQAVASCCGVFAWAGADQLLVFDASPDGTGSWLVNVRSGDRRFLSPTFGLASTAGVIALSVPPAGVTEVRRFDGSLVSSIANGGTRTWPSLDGSKVVWLERMPVPTPSSSARRVVRLWVSSIAGSNRRPVLDMQATVPHWLPDNRHVLLAARGVDGEAPGIWVLDTETGTYRVLVDLRFIQSVQLSPNGTQVAYLATFTGDPSTDGVWVASVNGDERWRVPIAGSFRWGGAGETLWTLELADNAPSSDVIVEIDIATGRERRRVPLQGRVLNSTWEISPDGRFVAYWRESDRRVVVLPLRGSS